MGNNVQCMLQAGTFRDELSTGSGCSFLPLVWPGPPMVSDAVRLPSPKAGFLTRKGASQNLQWHQVEGVLSKSPEKPSHFLGPLYLCSLGRGQRFTLYPPSRVAYQTRFRAQFHMAEATRGQGMPPRRYQSLENSLVKQRGPISL